MTASALPNPVTLLTGFLGSGKTTLLNHLIRDPGMGRVAVIINEFGDIGLDLDLIEEATEEIILLQSGCPCYTIRGDLVTAMPALLRRQALGEVAFNRVVIKTTGLADPAPILHTLLVERELAQAFRLDGVVTTACAATGPRSIDTQFEAVNQIALADRIVLTRTDLVTPPELRHFTDRPARINPGATRITADRVPPGALFGISGMHDKAAPDQTLAWVTAAYAAPISSAPPQPVAGGNPAYGLFAANPAETEEYCITSFAYRAQAPLDQSRVHAVLNGDLPGPIRAKGHFWIASRPNWMVEFSLAESMSSVTPLGGWWASVPGDCWPTHPDTLVEVAERWAGPWGDGRQEIVFNGARLDRAAITAAHDAALMTGPDFAPTLGTICQIASQSGGGRQQPEVRWG